VKKNFFGKQLFIMKLDSFRSWQDSVLKFNSDYVSVFEMKCEVEYNESYDFQGFQLVAI